MEGTFFFFFIISKSRNENVPSHITIIFSIGILMFFFSQEIKKKHTHVYFNVLFKIDYVVILFFPNKSFFFFFFPSFHSSTAKQIQSVIHKGPNKHDK